MLVPLYGFLEGDTMGLLILARDRDLIGAVAKNLQQAATTRVKPFSDPQVYFNNRRLNPQLSVKDAGLTALDRIDVRRDPHSSRD